MLYPIYVHKEDDSAYGAIFPDFPSCFTGADKLQDLPKAAQEAVRLNISLPEYLVHKIDAAAKAQHLSRSAFLAKAAEQEMLELEA